MSRCQSVVALVKDQQGCWVCYKFAKNLQYTNTYIVLVLNQCAQVLKRGPAIECGVFDVLLMGETGSGGKSAFINNLLAAEVTVATEGYKCKSETATETATITQYLYRYSCRSLSCPVRHTMAQMRQLQLIEIYAGK